MKPIGDPIELEEQTIGGLHKILIRLILDGHADMPIIRADSEAGPLGVNDIQLYDTSNEFERCELSEKRYFLIS